MVGEVAIEFEIHRNDLDRKCGQAGCGAQDSRNRHPAHSVTGIHHDANGLDAREVDQRAQIPGIVRENVHFTVTSRGVNSDKSVFQIVTGTITDSAEAGV